MNKLLILSTAAIIGLGTIGAAKAQVSIQAPGVTVGSPHESGWNDRDDRDHDRGGDVTVIKKHPRHDDGDVTVIKKHNDEENFHRHDRRDHDEDHSHGVVIK
jgi:hypothetical protein